jgi:carboxylesterase
MNDEENLAEIRQYRKGFVFEGNSDSAVILVHGIGGNASGVLPLAHYLHDQAGLTVQGLCLKGHAETPEALAKVRYEEWIRQGQEAFETLSQKYAQVYLVGNSLGSLVMIALAERVKPAGLILISSPLYYAHPIFYVAKFLGAFHLYHTWRGNGGLSSELAALVVYPKIPYKSVAELNKLQKLCRKNIAKVTTPVTAFFGEKDPLVGVAKSEAFLKKNVASAQLTLYPGEGHGLLFSPIKETLFASVKKSIVS